MDSIVPNGRDSDVDGGTPYGVDAAGFLCETRPSEVPAETLKRWLPRPIVECGIDGKGAVRPVIEVLLDSGFSGSY